MEYAEPIEVEVYESPDFLRRIRLGSMRREQPGRPHVLVQRELEFRSWSK